jgi:hypothetical protein
MWTPLFAGDLGHSAIFDNSKIKRFVPAFNPVVTWPQGVRWRAGGRAGARTIPTTPDPIRMLTRSWTGSCGHGTPRPTRCYLDSPADQRKRPGQLVAADPVHAPGPPRGTGGSASSSSPAGAISSVWVTSAN